MSITYVCQKLAAETERANKWLLYNRHDDGAKTLLGFHRTRDACVTVARVLSGRRKVEVREKPIRLDAWRLDTP